MGIDFFVSEGISKNHNIILFLSKIISFIILAPIIGMIVAFIISLWFIHAFSKGMMPKIIAFIILIGVVVFLKHNIETDPSKLKTNFSN
mgnify:CR=1 FL=1